MHWSSAIHGRGAQRTRSSQSLHSSGSGGQRTPGVVDKFDGAVWVTTEREPHYEDGCRARHEMVNLDDSSSDKNSRKYSTQLLDEASDEPAPLSLPATVRLVPVQDHHRRGGSVSFSDAVKNRQASHP